MCSKLLRMLKKMHVNDMKELNEVTAGICSHDNTLSNPSFVETFISYLQVGCVTHAHKD